MNKSLVWVGVLVVIVVVVVVLARGSGDEAAEGVRDGAKKGVVPKRPLDVKHLPYESIAKTWVGVPLSRQGNVFDDLDRLYVYGTGVVVTAEQEPEAGWYVEFDMDPEKGDGVDVTITTLLADVEGLPLPTVGEEFRFRGQVVDIFGEGDEWELSLDKGLVSK